MEDRTTRICRLVDHEPGAVYCRRFRVAAHDVLTAVMKFNLSKTLGLWMCRCGIHKYRIIEVKFGFGTSEQVETVVCERCNQVATRRSKKS